MMGGEAEADYSHFLSLLRRSTDLLTEDPIREEIFSVERLEQYATYLARQLRVHSTPRRGRPLLPNVKENGRRLLAAYKTLGNPTFGKQTVSPAAEWFLDNFHIVQEQLWAINRDLPKSYYDELPKLAFGELAGYPRIYAIALAIIAHTDSRLDPETLARFFRSYQTVSPLSIGELWAIAITLRIALLEHLEPLAQRIVSARLKRERADALADRLLKLATESQAPSQELIREISAEMGKPEEFDRAFVVQLIGRLRDQDPNVWPLFEWLEQQLKIHRTDTAQVIQLEHHRQAAAQITVGNIIRSMRFISSLDWRDFFESISVVDPILAQDPVGAYAGMDFPTRDRYRHSIERIAKRTRHPEHEVASRAVDMARRAQEHSPEDRRRHHVGFFLIDDGNFELEREFRYRTTAGEIISRALVKHPTLTYLGSVALATFAFASALAFHHWQSRPIPWESLAIFALLLIPASELALTMINHFVTIIIRPRVLPKMSTDRGIPAEARTMVVIPTLFTRASVVEDLIEKLQIHYLGNSQAHLSFALLGDFADSDREHEESDASLLALARAGIEELNRRYCGPDEEKRFYLFCRRRLWNASEGQWMGWERKRGKLLEFNRLLRGERGTSYLAHEADPALLTSIRYIITLDSDTQLPRDAARKLVGTIIHPLNRAQFCQHQKRVTKGYGILQPRVSVDLLSAGQSRFARIFSGNIGLDPYTTAVSDVYQDLFAEGSFTGKGLYDIDAFEMALKERCPENAVLSHDLFEGAYARAALVTDIEVYDDYPAHFKTFERRQHRWTRGDWQIAPWLFPKVPDQSGRMVPNTLSAISRWKIFDNLRRSLVAPTILLWLWLAWFVLPDPALSGTAPILLIFSLPIYINLITSLAFHPKDLPWREHIRLTLNDIGSQIVQVIFHVVFLISLAWSNVDAISRIFVRKVFSKKKLLEWVTFAQSQGQTSSRTREMLSLSPVLAVVTAGALAHWNPAALPVALPFLSLWLAEPALRLWSAQTPFRKLPRLGAEERATYRAYARRTWHFFERFVGPEGNWLAPDNFQEDPKPLIAFRTSPTNIGLQLLSTVSAHDFGYVGTLELVEKLENIFATLAKLPRFNGHFYNWYDTQTLEPLRPQYVSTVDSGNLAGHLIAVRQACAELATGHPKPSPTVEGFTDTLRLLFERAPRAKTFSRTSGTVTLEEFWQTLDGIWPQVATGDWNAISESLRNAEDMLHVLLAHHHESFGEAYREVQVWLGAALHQAREFRRDARELAQSPLAARFQALVSHCDDLMMAMDFRFLFDNKQKIFTIGYKVGESQRDASYYDLLASESRLASFVAIAKGDVNEEHWFRLGRQMTLLSGHGQVLVAWTATMFEYLMPLLVMRRYQGTLLDETYKGVVSRQIEYGRLNHVPWGISESGYNARDLNMNYQYGPFGIPGMGLKRGLSDDLVIAPYATMLAAMIEPWEALKNLRAFERQEVLGTYGFYESIDFTPQRLPENKKFSIIRSFMAHHQGMSLVALNNLLHDDIMPKRFHADPRVQATQLLLQEKLPRVVAISQSSAEEVQSEGVYRLTVASNPRFYSHMNVGTPRTQILSNGQYSVMVTSSGAGFSRCRGLAVTRWREDWTRDHWGQFFYFRDRGSGAVWSAGYQPTAAEPKNYEVTFAENKIEIKRSDHGLRSRMEIVVAPEDNVELRRLCLTNTTHEVRDIEVTSYAEVVLCPPAADTAHPAFSNLFVQTEFAAADGALLATRRRRAKHEKQIWGFHLAVCEGESVGPIQYETDRSRFIGRGHSYRDPVVITEDRPLSNSVGSVLDPIFSIRKTVRVLPGETAKVTFATGVAESREEALTLTDKYHDVYTFTREADIAWTQSQVQLRHLNISPEAGHLYQRLAGRILYSDNTLRPRSHALGANTRNQANLWAYGISGDHPIVLTRIGDEKGMSMVRDLLHAHEYFRLKGLTVDLVILNERGPSYLQSLQDALQRQLRMSGSHAMLDKSGGVFICRSDLMPEADVILLKSIARVVLNSESGTLAEQLKRPAFETELPEAFLPTARPRSYPVPEVPMPPLEFFNGLGGFSRDGQSYQIYLRDGQNTPAPWINVIANGQDFGCLISESGAGYTWSGNSRENRLTTWSNDPVGDTVSEALYLRDEATGEVWSPTPLPIRESEAYLIQHQAGSSRFSHTSHGIEQELLVSVNLESRVKVSRLKLRNVSGESRQLSLTAFAEWVLGFDRASNAPTIVTEFDAVSGALLARNPFSIEFGNRIAFFGTSGDLASFTCDRKEFLGRNGHFSDPAALHRKALSGRAGGGFDPCAALQTHLSLEPGEEKTLKIFLGQASDLTELRDLVARQRGFTHDKAEWEQIQNFWHRSLRQITVKTPDPAFNTLVNGWLLYQTLACRLWARSAFYQSGGAYGFRDQLQDVMALVYAEPKLAREQILRAASRQFVEGDVQHWWHPPTGRGVRTRFSDDLIWLPYVVSFYLKVTGDVGLLSEKVAFIEGPPLNPGQEDSYYQPQTSSELGTLYEHCARALDRSLAVGRHGLPLIGAGDWNDGMNRVGHEGQGESVWVAWFLAATLKNFVGWSDKRGDAERSRLYREHAENLREAVEKNAWDGHWYRRAYFDDGSPLGSAFSEECRIDSLTQSWAVLSGLGDTKRAVRAMRAVDEHLVDRANGIVKLFTPPFDRGSTDPGYIKGYVPGVRENGGQYTHAAIWTVMAHAALGQGDMAAELYSLLNPINHSATRAGVHKYKVEPYVIAADIYALENHIGRGGWTWYTGSASWMYRAALESILGLEVCEQQLSLRPCIPKHWREFELSYRHGNSEYQIIVLNSGGAEASITIDGQRQPEMKIPLKDDGKHHLVQIQL